MGHTNLMHHVMCHVINIKNLEFTKYKYKVKDTC